MGQTVRAMIKSGFKPFMGLETRTKRNQINAVHYIENLSVTTNSQKHVDKWDLFKIFGSSRNQSLIITNKNLINKKFFENLTKAPLPSTGRSLTKEDEKKVLALASSVAKNADVDSSLKSKRDDYIRAAKQHMVNFRKNLHEARKITLASKDPEALAQQMVEEIKNIDSDGYWKFYDVDGTTITFVTKNDVIVDWKKEKAKVHLRVNFGKFKATIDMNNSDAESGVSCYEFENNINYNSYIHPHITEDGEICWGTAADAVSDKLCENNIREVLALLSAILNSYNDAEPFADLAAFQALSPKTAPAGTKVEEYCNGCERVRSECECDNCDDEDNY